MSDLTVILNLVLAFILGGLIGIFREMEGKAAGLRTHILVCVGSALFMIISGQMVFTSSLADPGRIAAGVVAGIGFLGAGCIIQSRGSVQGITTAASIWITSGIGLAMGVGQYVSAVTATVLALITLELLRLIETRVFRTKGEDFSSPIP